MKDLCSCIHIRKKILLLRHLIYVTRMFFSCGMKSQNSRANALNAIPVTIKVILQKFSVPVISSRSETIADSITAQHSYRYPKKSRTIQKHLGCLHYSDKVRRGSPRILIQCEAAMLMPEMIMVCNSENK